MKSLDQFVQEEQARIAQFLHHYRQQHQTNPDAYPLTMDDPEWDEQFAIFCENISLLPVDRTTMIRYDSPVTRTLTHEQVKRDEH